MVLTNHVERFRLKLFANWQQHKSSKWNVKSCLCKRALCSKLSHQVSNLWSSETFSHLRQLCVHEINKLTVCWKRWGVFGAVQGVQGALRWRELHSGTTAPPVYSLATPRPAIKLSIWRARTKDRRFMAAVLKRALRQCYWFYKSVGVIGWRRDWINLPKKEKKPKYLFAFSKWSPIIGVGSGGGHAKHPGVAS